jgi:ubiquinone/menaquinone biosynthesis C-methylase UbiE
METYNSDLPKIEEFVQLDGKSLLEVGCGDGRLTALMAGNAGTIAAIDPDENSICAARKNVGGVNFAVGSGEKLEFAAESFDIVLFSYSLHHQDCTKALPEAQRVAGQNGQILIIEPTFDGEFSRLVSIFEPQEAQLLLRTLNYISSGLFNILRRDRYAVDYPFADENELYDYFITKFATNKEDQAVGKMQEIIENKKTNRPIIIQDVVNMLLIGKISDHQQSWGYEAGPSKGPGSRSAGGR